MQVPSLLDNLGNALGVVMLLAFGLLFDDFAITSEVHIFRVLFSGMMFLFALTLSIDNLFMIKSDISWLSF